MKFRRQVYPELGYVSTALSVNKPGWRDVIKTLHHALAQRGVSLKPRWTAGLLDFE